MKNKPAYGTSRNGVVRGGEDRVENPLARLAVPPARALDVVEVERVVAGQGAVQTCFQERCPPSEELSVFARGNFIGEK